MPVAFGSPARPIRLIITAASQLAVRQLARDLSADAGLQVKTAISATELVELSEPFKPTAVLLDTQLTGEETPQLARALAHLRNVAVVLYASASDRTSAILDALENGAIAVVTKPALVSQTAGSASSLIRALRSAAGASIPNLTAKTEFAKVTGQSSPSILALGAGMGGLPALTGVLMQLPANSPACIAVTGLSGALTADWTYRMSQRSSMPIKLAADGDAIQSGRVLIAPGDSHLIVRRSQGGLTVAVKPGPAVFHQMPSLELLFNSLADTAAARTVAAVFSGSGVDGVAGLLNLRKAGGRTIAQSPQTCACDELPTRALRTGGADIELPANEIANKLLECASEIQLPRAA
jgi:two-component system chemotaxis response regulator CheB